MVPTSLYLLPQKIRIQESTQTRRYIRSSLFRRSNQILATLLLLFLLISVILVAQKQVRNYKVIRNGDEIGWANVEKKTDSNITNITMGMEVKVRFILTFESSAKEVAQFCDGKLMRSYYYRKTNGNIKADRHTKLVGNSYEVEDKKRTKLDILPVTYNTLCMYFQEPGKIRKVYSDNHQCFLDIEKASDGGYKIVSPDDTSNTFYYTRGICYKVKINHSFYSAELLLK